jgi:hypothetical protein
MQRRCTLRSREAVLTNFKVQRRCTSRNREAVKMYFKVLRSREGAL